MLLRNVKLAEPSFQMSHLLKHESVVRQTPERFFVRFERALEIAQNAVAINALSEPRFPKLGLERYRPICDLLHRGTAIRLQINTEEIEQAARDGEAGPCQRELRIKPDRLGIKASDPVCCFEGLGGVDRDRAQVNVIRCRILGWLLHDGFLLSAGK